MKKALQKFWRDYFDFTQGERNALLILIVITLGCSVYPLLNIDAFKDKRTDFSELIAIAEQSKTDSADAENPLEAFREYPERYSSKAAARFRFNPNTASVKQLESLGFKSYIAKRIEKYRASGGRFRVKADLGKVYGIDHELVNSLWNDIELPESFEKNGSQQTDKIPYAKPVRPLIEINSADTGQLVALPGIGSKLAQRIVDFRTRLGGFYSLDQLKEVYGLKPETIEMIWPLLSLDREGISYLNINTADSKMLDAHPYINRIQANAIVEYRKQHGQFTTVNDLSKILVLDELLLNKIKSYIKF